MSPRAVGLPASVRVLAIACVLVVSSVLAINSSCSRGAGQAQLEALTATSGDGSAEDAGRTYDRPPLKLDRILPPVAEPGKELYAIALRYEEGAEHRYELTNDIVTYVSIPEIDQIATVTSGLGATQTARVRRLDGSGAEILISTFDVVSNVEGDEEIAEILRIATASIEGSRLVGNYDEFGRGTDVYLEQGIGLSPIGAQAGGQDMTVGLMGLLLSPEPVPLGKSWSGAFDFTASVESFLSSVDGTVVNGEFPIVFTLESVNEEENYVVIGIRSEGRPTIIMPLAGGAEVTSEMHVLMEGRALIDLDTGWLSEMKVTTTVDYSGFLPGVKQTVLSITRRIS